MTLSTAMQHHPRDKASLREAVLARRDALPADVRQAAAQVLAGREFPAVVAPGLIVSGFMPMRSEINPLPLMRRLAGAGAKLALPVVKGRGHPLTMRAYAFGDPLDAGQDLSTHLAKILRIDVSPAVAAATGETPTTAAVGGRAYAIPPDNPFVQGDILIDLFNATEEDFAALHPNAVPETWAYGLRNPWSFSFDRETGDFWIGDVGQNFWEEINFQPAGSRGGQNYGWKFLQGSHCFPYSLDPDCPHVGTLPVAEYHHDLGCVVVGGSVYRGADYADLNGIYFAADYCSGRIWGVARDDSETWQMQELLDTGLLITGHGEDEAGNIYFTNCYCGYGQIAPQQQGSLWMLVAADQVPDGAETAPLGEAGPPPAQDEGNATPESAYVTSAVMPTAAGRSRRVRTGMREPVA